MKETASFVGLVLAIASCSKAEGPATRSMVDASTRPIVGTTPAAPSASAMAEHRPAAWSGRYTAVPGSFSVPDGGEWAGVRFRGEDAGLGLGEGVLTLSVSDDGRVSGSLEGPLGPLRVTGELLDATFSATLVSADPAHGFAGTALGSVAGSHLSGSMRLSLPTGNVLREATFKLEESR